MTLHFNITPSSDVIKLDSQTRQGEAAFAVTNQSDRVIWGRAVTKVLDAAAHPWLTITDDAERAFQPGECLPYTVTIKVPPEAGAGNYRFQLDMLDVSAPEKTDTSSPVVNITVPGAIKLPWQTIAIVASVVAVAAIIVSILALLNPAAAPAEPTVIPSPAAPVWSRLRVETGTTTVQLRVRIADARLTRAVNDFMSLYPSVKVNLIALDDSKAYRDEILRLTNGKEATVGWVNDALFTSVLAACNHCLPEIGMYFGIVQWAPTPDYIRIDGSQQVGVGNWVVLNNARIASASALMMVLAYENDGVLGQFGPTPQP